MTDLSAAPQTGASEPVADSSPAEGATAVPAEKASAKPSTREAIDRAFAQLERAPNETDKAAAVLKGGAGADDKLVADAAAKTEKAAAEADKPSEASERAAKGWETRRANEEKAAAEAKEAEKAAKAEPVKAAEPKPAEPEKVAETPKSEPSKYKAPTRLSKEAQAAWEAAPEPLRADVVRMHDEMTAGLTKYKEGADKYAELAEYETLAKDHYGAPLKDVLKNYADIDRGLADPENWPDQIEKLISFTPYGKKGGDLKGFAEWVLEQESAPQDQVVAGLRGQIAKLETELGKVTQDVTQRRESENQQSRAQLDSKIAEFWKASPRADELASHMEMLISSPKFERSGDHVTDLKKAYEMAERLNPAPSLPTPAPAIPASDPAAHTQKGQLSVSGSPSLGSNPTPAKQPASPSTRNAVQSAFERLGL